MTRASPEVRARSHPGRAQIAETVTFLIEEYALMVFIEARARGAPSSVAHA